MDDSRQPMPSHYPAEVAKSAPPVEPAQPVGGPRKEFAPLPPEASVKEYVRPTEVEPTIQPEVQEYLHPVENSERPKLTEEHKSVGIDHAPEAAPVTVSDTPAVQLPYTYQQATEIMKKTPIGDSKHWLAALAEYLARKIKVKGASNGTRS